MDTQIRVTELAIDLINPPHLVSKEIREFHARVEHWILHEGLNGIKRAKAYFDHLLNTLLEQPVPELSWIKKSQDGTPILLRQLYKWAPLHPKEALTLLRIHELYNDTLTDTKCLSAMESITDPSTAVNTPEFIETILEEAAKLAIPTLKVGIGSVPMFTNGPNGIAILSAHSDARAHHRYGTVETMFKLSDRIAACAIDAKTSQCTIDMFKSFTDYSGEELGRLVFLPEKSGKLRVIATGDYHSQTVLKPVHDSINLILRRIKSDYTFDQEAGKRWMIDKTGTQKWMASYDLSSATDRLPAWLQAKVIDVALPGQLGDLWLDFLTNRQFLVNLPSGKQMYVKYSVGQPMGFYSSFAAFALLHHCVVRAAYRLAHKCASAPSHQFYSIIGDDMVITDKKAGEMYCKIIQDIGGVVNLTKSRISTTPGVTIGEFAKAWSINGKDITPFSLRAIRSGLNSPLSLPSMINNMGDKFGSAVRTKKLKFLLQKYWPKEANTLIGLIPVPRKLGGFGKPNSEPLVEAIRGSQGNALRIFIANKVHSSFRKIINISDDCLNDMEDSDLNRDQLRLAMEPLLRLIRDREAEMKCSLINTTRKSFIRWVLEEDVPLSTLLNWLASMVDPLPITMRETLPPDSLSWVKALEDDRKSSSPGPIDSDIALQFAALELIK